MSLITCKRCGHSSSNLTQIFCTRCGAKLDLSSVGETTFTQRWAGIFRLMRMLVSLAVLAVAGLGFWPEPPPGSVGTPAEMLKLSGKLWRLEQAALQGRALQERATEAELNAYLEEILRRNPQLREPAGRTVGIATWRLRLHAGWVELFVGARWGGLPLTATLQVTPQLANGRLGVVRRGARWGHLPLPAPAADWLLVRVGALTASLSRERALLDQLQQLDFAEGAVSGKVGPARP